MSYKGPNNSSVTPDSRAQMDSELKVRAAMNTTNREKDKEKKEEPKE